MKYITLLLFGGLLLGQELTTEAIVDSMLVVMTPENARGLSRQINKTSSGAVRTLEYEYYADKGGEDVFMRYTKPNKVKGTAFLMTNHADDIWVYFPRTRRTRKLASHAKKQKVQGSDFAYEDFAGGRTWKDDYTHRRLPHEKAGEYKLEFVPKPEISSSYSKMVLTLGKKDFFPKVIKYYNTKGVHEKTLYMQDIKLIEGYPTAMTMVMHNELNGTETRMETLEMTYSVSFPKDFFSEGNLKK